MNKIPDTPIFARKNSLKRGAEQAQYKNFSFAEICGNSPNDSLDFLQKARKAAQKLDFSIYNLNENNESMLERLLRQINECKDFTSESAKKQLEFRLKQILEEHLEQGEKSQKGEEEAEVIKKLAKDIEKISDWKLNHCENWDQFSEALCSHIKKLLENTKKCKDLVEKFMSKLKEVRENIKKLLENFKVTEYPEAPKLLESEQLPIRRKLSDVKIEKNLEVLPDNLESLKIELQMLENKLKSKCCKPNEVISRILAIKNKISEIRTRKTISRNRELSEKVRRGLDSIEKAWVLTEGKPSTPSLRDQSNDYMAEMSPIGKLEKSRPISPILSKTVNTSGFLSEISDDQRQISLSIRLVKQKEQALDYLNMTRKSKEVQLDSLISEYKKKLSDLEEEHDCILKIKAKTFSEAKKLKDLENNLKKKEYTLNSARDRISEDDEEHWVDLKMKERSLADIQTKLNSELKHLHREKEKFCKVKSVVDYRMKAINEVWPFVKSTLKEFKSLRLT